MTARLTPARADLQAGDPRVVFLVPWRSDGAQREALWRVCRARWSGLFPDWPIVEGTPDDGPFNRAQAINRAAASAEPWDVALIIDADVFLPEQQVRDAVARAIETGRPTWAHRGWVGLTERFTRRVIEDGAALDPDAIDLADQRTVEKVTPLSWSCCIAVPRVAWETLGGFDERFRGWGHEDGAFAAKVQGLTGHERIEGHVFNLWHPRVPGAGRAGRDERQLLTADAVRNELLGNRYYLALRRDHGLHDRPREATPEEMVRDIENIRGADDRRHRSDARRLGMPDWSGWWPTLEELRDGAAPTGSVALIVHSGGTPQSWADRRLYLSETLASIAERLHAPAWERRVIYTDWGPELRPEVEGIAAEHGYYVVGPEGRQGYTGSMRNMWHYIEDRVRADFVFQSEDDFALTRDVDLAPMMTVLREQPHLVQLALLRSPFYPAEMVPGTVLGHPPSAFSRRSSEHGCWLEHTRFFTVNPMLMRRSLAAIPWPVGHHSEASYGHMLFSEPTRRAGLWGDGEAWCAHLGETRAAEAGY